MPDAIQISLKWVRNFFNVNSFYN